MRKIMLVMLALIVALALVFGTVAFAAAAEPAEHVSAAAVYAAPGYDRSAEVSGESTAENANTTDPPGVLDVFVAMVTLAVLIETIAEWIKSTINPATLPKWAWLCITSAVGIALCIGFTVNIFTALGFAGAAAMLIVGEVLTGIAVGAGSSFVHVLLNKIGNVQNAGAAVSNAVKSTDDENKDQTNEG